MKPPYLKTGLIILVNLLIIAVVVALLWRPPSKSTSTKPQIVASTNVWGDITSQIGGNHIEVTSILSDPEADPHLFESDAQTASQIAAADLVITNGVGYDEFMDKLLAASPKDATLSMADVLQAKAAANPHLWYDLPRIPEVAIAIQNQLIKLDPAHAEIYQGNAKQFIAELQPLINKLTPHNQGVAYTERVAGYLIEDLGLTDKTPQGFSQAVESGSEPSPQQVQEFERVLKSGQVKVLLYNNQAVNQMTEQLQATAKAAGVTVVGVSETIPKGKNFQTWQLAQLNAILKAL